MKYLLLRYSLLWIKQITKKIVDIKLTVKSGRKGPVLLDIPINIQKEVVPKKNFKKQNKNQSHTGFIVGKDHIFVTLSTGYIIKVSVINGKPLNVYKTNRGYISKPYVHDKHLYIISDKFIKKFD